MLSEEQWTNLKRGVQLLVILTLAAGLKLYYSAAGVNGLRWILAPTTYLVHLATGMNFEFESFTGYMSSDRTFVIAAVCSGVNFLMISFLVLTLGKLWRTRPRTIGWYEIPAAMAAAYCVTVAANAARISLAILLRPYTQSIGSISAENLHRIEGIAVYFGALLLLFLVSERMNRSPIESRLIPTAVIRTSALPLGIYYFATLIVPAANGAYRETGFWQHAILVFIAPPVIIITVAAIVKLLNGNRKQLN